MNHLYKLFAYVITTCLEIKSDFQQPPEEGESTGFAMPKFLYIKNIGMYSVYMENTLVLNWDDVVMNINRERLNYLHLNTKVKNMVNV